MVFDDGLLKQAIRPWHPTSLTWDKTNLEQIRFSHTRPTCRDNDIRFIQTFLQEISLLVKATQCRQTAYEEGTLGDERVHLHIWPDTQVKHFIAKAFYSGP